MTHLEKPVRRLTAGALDYRYGCDRGRRLVASLERGDLLTLKPYKTRRSETISLFDVYAYAIRCRVNRTQLERARLRKAQLEAKRHDATLRRSIRQNRNIK